MLRDPATAALNDLLVALKDAVAHYRDVAGSDIGADLARILTALADEREAMARRLDGFIRARGDLPDAGDPEQETLDLLFTDLKALLFGERRTVAREAAAGERRLAELAATAAGGVDAPELRAFLGWVRERCERAAGVF